MLRKIYVKIRLLAKNRKEPYFLLSDVLGFIPNSIEPYREAFSHCSANIETKNGGKLNNERLEYLGDTILNTVVSDILYRKYPSCREGFLTNMRSKIVQRKNLDYLAEEMDIHSLLRISSDIKHTHNHIGGNALEALIGAVYIDKGYKSCYKFITEKLIAPYINLETLAASEENYKSRLMEWGQKYKVEIDYTQTDSRVDKNSNLLFTFNVSLQGVKCGSGTGYSKKEAQQVAAAEAYKALLSDKSLESEIFAAKSALSDNAPLNRQAASPEP